MDEQEFVPVAEPVSAVPPPPMALPAAGGLSDNQAGALAYLTIIPAILFLVLAPYNRRTFVRFNAFQCLLLALFGFLLHFLMIIPILGWLVVILGDVCLVVAWVICVVKALGGTKFKLPLLGDFAEQLAAQV